jgi:hypothetical protein
MERHEDIQAKLQKLEELFPRGATEGERAAAGAALDRFAARLDHVSQEAETEIRYSLPDTWAVRIFVALCRKHGVRPYRYPRQRAYHSYGPCAAVGIRAKRVGGVPDVTFRTRGLFPGHG